MYLAILDDFIIIIIIIIIGWLWMVVKIVVAPLPCKKLSQLSTTWSVHGLD